MYHYQLYPHRVVNPLGHIDAPSSTATSSDIPQPPISSRASPNGDDVPLVSRNNTLRRHKSTKELRSKPSFSGSEEANKNNGGLSRHGSRRGAGRGTDGPLINPFDRESFSKGSLLANSNENEQIETTPRHSPIPPPPPSLPVAEELQQQPQTLIQIEDRVKFSKGSLLDKSVHGSSGNMNSGGSGTSATSGLSRSKSTRESSSHHHHSNEVAAGNGEGTGGTRRQMSVRRKPTTSRSNRRPEVPVMPAAPSIPGNGPLLQQDEDPEQAHTRKLMERQIKPLVNFNTPSSGFNPNRRY